jgi:phosphoglycolate phosphatase
MTAVLSKRIAGVLFDLDGTLADTAPDLAAAANRMRLVRGLAEVPYEELRPQASHGARGLLGVAFGVHPGDTEFEALRIEFLESYERALCVHSKLFPGIGTLLDDLNRAGLPWGIVTNKARRFTEPLVKLLAIADGSSCVVSGDTTPHSKPHPAPLLEAARQLNLPAQHCVYIGDDARDIAAGQAADMATVAAAYGYCGDSDARAWGADVTVTSVAEIFPLIRAALLSS